MNHGGVGRGQPLLNWEHTRYPRNIQTKVNRERGNRQKEANRPARKQTLRCFFSRIHQPALTTVCDYVARRRARSYASARALCIAPMPSLLQLYRLPRQLPSVPVPLSENSRVYRAPHLPNNFQVSQESHFRCSCTKWQKHESHPREGGRRFYPPAKSGAPLSRGGGQLQHLQ